MNDFIGWIVDCKNATRLYNLQFEDISRIAITEKMKKFIKDNWDMFKDIKDFLIVVKDNRDYPDNTIWFPMILEYRGLEKINIKYTNKEVNPNFYKEIK